MAGVLTITKKEFVDHVTDQTFLICFGILMIAMIGATIFQLDKIYLMMDYVTHWVGSIESVPWKDPDVSEMLQTVLSFHLSTLGALVALAVSFNSINKERIEGSLRVLLSYPVQRARVILGKLMGGLLVISLVVATSLTVSFGLEMYFLSIPLTSEFIFRVLAVTVAGILLLSFFMCLSMAISMIVKDQASCLLGSLLVLAILQPDTYAMVLVTIGNAFPHSIADFSRWLRYYIPNLQQWQLPDILFWLSPGRLAWTQTIWGLTPVLAYRKFAGNIFHFQNVYPASMAGPAQVIGISFDWVMSQNSMLLLFPFIYTLLAFAACLLLFSRGDIT